MEYGGSSGPGENHVTLGKLRLGKTQWHAKVIQPQWAGSWHLRGCACLLGGISKLHFSVLPPPLHPGCVIRAPGVRSPLLINSQDVEVFPGDHCLKNKSNGPNTSVTFFVPRSIPSPGGSDA